MIEQCKQCYGAGSIRVDAENRRGYTVENCPTCDGDGVTGKAEAVAPKVEVGGTGERGAGDAQSLPDPTRPYFCLKCGTASAASQVKDAAAYRTAVRNAGWIVHYDEAICPSCRLPRPTPEAPADAEAAAVEWANSITAGFGDEVVYGAGVIGFKAGAAWQAAQRTAPSPAPMNQNALLMSFGNKWNPGMYGAEDHSAHFWEDLIALLEKVAQDAHDHVAEMTAGADAIAEAYTRREGANHD